MELSKTTIENTRKIFDKNSSELMKKIEKNNRIVDFYKSEENNIIYLDCGNQFYLKLTDSDFEEEIESLDIDGYDPNMFYYTRIIRLDILSIEDAFERFKWLKNSHFISCYSTITEMLDSCSDFYKKEDEKFYDRQKQDNNQKRKTGQ
ncbi:MAG: hypothetical protein ACRCUM_03975 [Mycoplasmoidaceae bacterium]